MAPLIAQCLEADLASASYCTPMRASGRDTPSLDALDTAIARLDASISVQALAELDWAAHLGALCARVWNAPHARISLGGTSLSNVLCLGHVLPRLHPDRRVVLVDRLAHQSVYGGLIQADFDVAWLHRESGPRGTRPLQAEQVRAALDRFGAGSVCALHYTVCPYGAPRDPEQERAILELCRARGVPVCIDAAWAATHGLFAGSPPAVAAYGDIVLLSPHKKGLTPQPIGVMLFHDPAIGALADEAAELGLHTTSPNFVMLAIAERRLLELLEGRFDKPWRGAVRRATRLRRALAGRGWLVPDGEDGSVADVTHVRIRCPNGRSAGAVAGFLRPRGITVEADFSDGVLLLLGPPGPAPGMAAADAALLDALADFDAREAGS